MSEVRILVGDCRDAMPTLDAVSIDAIVCDPPYELVAGKKGGTGTASVNLASPYGRSRIGTGNGPGGFMGHAWDSSGVAFDPATWAAALRVLKPGGHLVAFGSPRTHHRLMVAVEDAGFELRDVLMYLFGSGFPKSHNLEGEWEGWGTALKPAYEPIILARKPLAGTVAETVTRYGTGALNIDASRIGTDDDLNGGTYSGGKQSPILGDTRSSKAAGRWGEDGRLSPDQFQQPTGRWPANVVLSHHPDCVETGTTEVTGDGHYPRARGESGYEGGWGGQAGLAERSLRREVVATFDCHPECPVRLLDAQSGPSGASAPVLGTEPSYTGQNGIYSPFARIDSAHAFYGDSGGASRFFYTSKASRSEREIGMVGVEPQPLLWSSGAQNPGSFQAEGTNRTARNNHPTVKPLDLMTWLCRLVTPPGGVILDPFLGSGTTGIAADRAGFGFIGIELEPAYAEIARRRMTGDAPLFANVTLERIEPSE